MRAQIRIVHPGRLQTYRDSVLATYHLFEASRNCSRRFNYRERPQNPLYREITSFKGGKNPSLMRSFKTSPAGAFALFPKEALTQYDK